MELLRNGSAGAEVQKWQMFLVGQLCYRSRVDGLFGPFTERATGAFQKVHHLLVTGVVDHDTLHAAMTLGYEVVDDFRDAEYGPNYPPPPAGLQPLNQAGRERLFGKLSYSVAGDILVMKPSWATENLVRTPLAGIQGMPVMFNKAVSERVQELFEHWKADGLLDRIVSFDGSYAPRFVRGSTTTISAHAWGTAFDLNARANALGAIPAMLGKPGCVRELVTRANEFGFYWGGHFNGRKDGMHFEAARSKAGLLSWLAQKVAEGWVYGKEKNAELKTHPCMVPFSELPREQQAKDFIFRSVVHALNGN